METQTKPKITMITATYNSEKMLGRAIDSVLAQNYSNLEYILIDGGSTDGTVELIKSYGDRITRWISEPDRGISDAFNKGIGLSTGDVIGIINSDDGLEPGALQAVADAFDPSVDVYRGKLLLWSEKNDVKAVEKPSMVLNLMNTNHIDHPSTFIARKAYEKFGCYDITLKYAMDYDLLLRFQNGGAKFFYVDKTLAFFTLGGVSSTVQYSPQNMEEIERVLRQNGGSSWNVFCFRFIKRLKKLITRFLDKEKQLRWKKEAY